MKKTGQEKMGEWFDKATPQQLQWARDYLPRRQIALATGPANDLKAIFMATLKLNPQECLASIRFAGGDN